MGFRFFSKSFFEARAMLFQEGKTPTKAGINLFTVPALVRYRSTSASILMYFEDLVF
jgi:hypothetical protein